ncbi:MAG: hypothetical protein DMF78_21615 [Acidobacteria bacterium]|nr:MAG: hypothetical protein DMF78_21615 [Acidobacteriota bacterium]
MPRGQHPAVVPVLAVAPRLSTSLSVHGSSERTGCTRTAATTRPPSGTATRSWSSTYWGWPFTHRRSSRSPRRRRWATVSNVRPSALTATSMLRGRRASGPAERSVRPSRTRGAGSTYVVGARGSGCTHVAGSPSPAGPAEGSGSTVGDSGGAKASNTTARPAALRRALPPARPSCSSNARGAGRSVGTSGVSTQATFLAKRTSSRFGSGWWRKRSFQGCETITRSPVSKVSR